MKFRRDKNGNNKLVVVVVVVVCQTLQACLYTLFTLRYAFVQLKRERDPPHQTDHAWRGAWAGDGGGEMGTPMRGGAAGGRGKTGVRGD